MAYTSFSVDFQIDILVDGKSVKTTPCTMSYYDSDINDCEEMEFDFDRADLSDAVIDSVDEALSDHFHGMCINTMLSQEGEMIQIKYDSVSETAEVSA